MKDILLILLGLFISFLIISICKYIGSIKVYKHYFSKYDSPFDPKYFKGKELHTSWFRYRYGIFLGHNVVKIKAFGLFTIYEAKEQP